METELFRLGNINMYVSDDHRFGTDAFLLAHYANVHKNDIVCDLCTGCGIIPLIFCKRVMPRRVYGVEIQEEAVELFRKTVSENGLDNAVPVLCDLRDIPQSLITWESADVVTANPPYMTGGSGAEKLSRAQAVARHELMCDINDVCKAAARLLKYGGLFKMCNRPERLGDVICAMRENKLEPKSVTFVFNSVKAKPWLFLISGKKGANPGMTVEKPTVLYDENGGFTEDYRRLYE